ncbi:glycosyltransferase [Aquimarina litoralis]|uniref:glycosyltransferase n=1 Tax=Aquimarina litoralis TaxID=584605 RepID=UPI001C562CA8|nr:glycosyltransferase [Aquimarina litoralis]MBW1295767.1 glycosyltransferase [Aquimarina litoralis]
MKFSIITITYNRAQIIGETIESVRNQSYKNYEHIVIDDGSNDNTKEVIENYKDPKIIYHKIKKVGKLSVLRNTGLKKATGDLITFLDSDDILYPNKLEHTLKVFLEHKHIEIIVHNLALFNEHGIYKDKVYQYNKDFQKNILIDLLYNKFQPYSSYTFTQNVLKNIGVLDESLSDGQHDFFARIVSDYEAYFIHNSLIKLRKHIGNMSLKESEEPFIEYLKTLQHLYESKKISRGHYLNRKSYIYSEMARINAGNDQFKTFLKKSNAHIKLNIEGIKIILKNVKLYVLRKSYINFYL